MTDDRPPSIVQVICDADEATLRLWFKHDVAATPFADNFTRLDASLAPAT